jgi:putative ABC transport system ATP-binding protein
MIEVDSVTKSFSGGAGVVTVLRSVSCQFAPGSCSFILGPSGSGKSTLLSLLGMLDFPTSGAIRVQGRNLSELSTAEQNRFRRDDIGFIFQSFNLLRNLDALQNVLMPFMTTGVSPARKRMALELLERVGLKDRWHHRPSQLSGGEQQRVAIARAILKQPQLILADEPTGELDSHSGQIVFDLLRELQQEHRSTVITVTHDDRYLQPGDRILRMENGQIHTDSAVLAAMPAEKQ